VTTTPPSEDRNAALQALASLGEIAKRVEEQATLLAATLDDSVSLEELLANPDSPINVRITLEKTRAAAAAYRGALEPFARAYTRKMEPLSTSIPIFIDPKRPEKNRSIKSEDVREAARVFFYTDIGAQTVRRLKLLEELAVNAASAIRLALADSANRLTEEHANTLRGIISRSAAYNKNAHLMSSSTISDSTTRIVTELLADDD
jgi:hypothetical protein